MKLGLIVGILLGAVLTSISLATSTISGPSGLISVPTAEALKYKEFNVSVDYNYSSLSEDNVDFFQDSSRALKLNTSTENPNGYVCGSVDT